MKIAKKLADVDCCGGTEYGLFDNNDEEWHFPLRIKEGDNSYHFLVRLCDKEVDPVRLIREKIFLIALETRYRMNRLRHVFYAPSKISEWIESFVLISEHVLEWNGRHFWTWFPSLELVVPDGEKVHLKKLQSDFGKPTRARTLFCKNNVPIFSRENWRFEDWADIPDDREMLPGFRSLLKRGDISHVFDEYQKMIDPYFCESVPVIDDIIERLCRVGKVSDWDDLQTLLLLERCSLENRQAILNVFAQGKELPHWALTILQR